MCIHNIQVGKKDESNTTVKSDVSEFKNSFITGIDIKTTQLNTTSAQVKMLLRVTRDQMVTVP